MAPLRNLRHVVADDDALDTVEVPAAVVCARCGKPDCPGCPSPEESTLPSGVVAIVPWERPVGSGWSRLWMTARAATFSAETFLGAMPSGDLAGPLRFALACELIAVASWALLLLGAVSILAPGLVIHAMRDPVARSLLLRVVLVAIPGFASLLIIAKLVWGWAIDRGARRVGSRSHRSRAMRFGLYAAGWDLMGTPLGWIYLLGTDGIWATLRKLPAPITVPNVAMRALFRRIYHLDDVPMAKARRFAAVVVSAVALVGVLFVMSLIAALLVV